MKRILVCGGRDYGKVDARRPIDHPKKMAERRKLRSVMNELLMEFGAFQLIHGGAGGTDALAGGWATDTPGMPLPKVYMAEWSDLSHPDAVIKVAKGGPNKGRQYDANAGPRRNAKMLAEGRPDLVVAFPGGRGTADMVGKARESKVEVREVQ